MKKFTAQDVLAVNPGLAADVVARVVEDLNRPPIGTNAVFERDDPSFIAGMMKPPPRDRDGLTEAERAANSFADERGLPIPFPPNPDHER